MVELNDKAFTEYGIAAHRVDRDLDHLGPQVIKSERSELKKKAQPVLDYANLLIAHRSPLDDEPANLKIVEIHDDTQSNRINRTIAGRVNFSVKRTSA